MSGEIFDFEWHVHEAGYDVLDTSFIVDSSAPGSRGSGGKGGRVSWIALSGGASSSNLLARRKYYPLRDHTCLFRIFAETSIDPEGIVAFANRYGLLGVEADAPASRERSFMDTAEPYGSWELEIRAMRSALNLWDLVSAKDRSVLAEYLRPLVDMVRSDISGGSRDQSGPEILTDADSDELRWFRMHPEVVGLYDAGELELVALRRVQSIVNDRLTARVSPKILWDDHRRQEWGLYFVPESLIGTIWIQFAQAVTQNKKYRRCRQCESWFEIDHYKARTNRYFCSNACRSKAYRERQSEAKKMRDDGESLAAIADKLGSDEATVRKWVD